MAPDLRLCYCGDMPNQSARTVNFTIRLTHELLAELRAEAQARGMTVAAVILERVARARPSPASKAGK